MKKAIIAGIGIIVILLSFSFTELKTENERTIKITSERLIEFDMVQNGKTTKGIKTPYEFKFREKDGNFIFKSNEKEVKLKLSVEDKKGSLNAQWEIIVLIIDNKEMSTFGMN